MSLETHIQEKTRETNPEAALEIFKRMVDERRKREAMEYFDSQTEEAKRHIKNDPAGRMYLKEASLYGI